VAKFRVNVEDLPVEINGVDQDGNVWPEPLRFGKDGTLTVPDDQQDVIAALESAVGAGAVERVKEPSSSSGKE
jgi:hypothetical protein